MWPGAGQTLSISRCRAGCNPTRGFVHLHAHSCRSSTRPNDRASRLVMSESLYAQADLSPSWALKESERLRRLGLQWSLVGLVFLNLGPLLGFVVLVYKHANTNLGTPLPVWCRETLEQWLHVCGHVVWWRGFGIVCLRGWSTTRTSNPLPISKYLK